MNFAFTGFLLGGLAVAIPIILHLLKRKPTDAQSFPAFDFLRPTLAKKQSRNNIRKWLILLFRCLAILALALAFAWPYLPNFAKNADEATVLLWDNSFSMQAANYADDLKNKAIDIIKQTDDKNPLLIGMVTKKTIWNDNFSGNSEEVLNWFNQNVNSDQSSLFERAIREANARLEAMPVKKKKIIIISDNQFIPWKNVLFKSKLSPKIDIKYITPKKQGFDNVAITNAELLNPFVKNKQEIKIKVTIENYTQKTYKGNLILKYKGNTSKKIDINSGLNNIIFSLKTEKKKPFPISFKLKVDDQLKSDNKYNYSVIPITLPVVYFTPSQSKKINYIKEVFSPTNQKKYLEIAELADTTTLGDLKKAVCLIVNKGFLSNSKKGKLIDQYLIDGGNVIVTWNGSAEIKKMLMKYGISFSPFKSDKVQFFESIDFNHPIMKIFNEVRIGNLFNIMFFNPPKISLPENAKTIALFSNGFPAISEIPVKKGRVFMIATKLEQESTNWQSDASFLPFWRELLSYCNKKTAIKHTFNLEDKKTFFKNVKKIVNLDTKETAEINNIVFRPNKVGNYLITIDDKETLISINLPLEESKSVLLSKTIIPENLKETKNIKTAEVAKENLTKEQGKSYWWILLCLGLIFSFIELILANRTGL